MVKPHNPKVEKQTEKVKTKVRALGIGQNVKVKGKLYNGASFEGYVDRAGDDDFTIVDKTGASRDIKYSDVKSIGGGNLSTGAKIAIGVGIGVGATLLVLYLVFRHITRNN